mgnify:CR=1 FL=1
MDSIRRLPGPPGNREEREKAEEPEEHDQARVSEGRCPQHDTGDQRPPGTVHAAGVERQKEKRGRRERAAWATPERLGLSAYWDFG